MDSGSSSGSSSFSCYCICMIAIILFVFPNIIPSGATRDHIHKLRSKIIKHVSETASEAHAQAQAVNPGTGGWLSDFTMSDLSSD